MDIIVIDAGDKKQISLFVCAILQCMDQIRNQRPSYSLRHLCLQDSTHSVSQNSLPEPLRTCLHSPGGQVQRPSCNIADRIHPMVQSQGSGTGGTESKEACVIYSWCINLTSKYIKFEIDLDMERKRLPDPRFQ